MDMMDCYVKVTKDYASDGLTGLLGYLQLLVTNGEPYVAGHYLLAMYIHASVNNIGYDYLVPVKDTLASMGDEYIARAAWGVFVAAQPVLDQLHKRGDLDRFTKGDNIALMSANLEFSDDENTEDLDTPEYFVHGVILH